MNRRFSTIAAVSLFVVLFNVGSVFHEPLMGAWFQQQEAAIAREQFIIPLIAVAFVAYSLVLAVDVPSRLPIRCDLPTNRCDTPTPRREGRSRPRGTNARIAGR